MKLANTMYAWNPVRLGGFNAGEIKVGPHPDHTDWTLQYVNSLGACMLSFKQMSDQERLTQMFIDFHTLVVRDGIEAQKAHREFLKIDEYRRAISPDIDVAEIDN